MAMDLKICGWSRDRRTAVESHICQNRADMGHPSFVTDINLIAGSDSVTQGPVSNAV